MCAKFEAKILTAFQPKEFHQFWDPTAVSKSDKVIFWNQVQSFKLSLAHVPSHVQSSQEILPLPQLLSNCPVKVSLEQQVTSWPLSCDQYLATPGAMNCDWASLTGPGTLWF